MEEILLEPCIVCTRYDSEVWYSCSIDHKCDSKTMEFIKKARDVHGWRYGYEKVKYVRSGDKVTITCGIHGIYDQRGNGHINGKGCRICAGNDPKTAENNFRKKMLELGVVIIGEYKGRHNPIKCICPKGHDCNPRPGDIQRGQGMCIICVGNDPKIAEENFRKKIEYFGGKVIGKYKGAHIPVKCRCSSKHYCNPTPHSIRKGHGMCRICAGNDPKTAENNFRKKIEELGGKVIAEYTSCNIPVKCLCPRGHHCNPRPGDIQRGQGMCSKCLLCPSCGLWRTRGILCVYCKPKSKNKLYSKTKEMDVVRFLREQLPDEEFIHNRSVGRECTDGHLFPDIRFDRVFYNLIVEVDEHKHSGSGYECDRRRMYDIIAKVGTPCIFIRYNPDAKECDRNLLLSKVQEYLAIDEEEMEEFPWDDYGFCVEYLFY